jgi:hypothetical protein
MVSFYKSLSINIQAADEQHTKSPENKRMHNSGEPFFLPSHQSFLAESENYHVSQPLLDMIDPLDRFQGKQ